MKIDEIIKKSIEVPGISIKRSEYSAELILKEKDGKGSMTFFPLFPGLTLAYIFINSPTWAAPDFRDNGSIETGPLLLNYCVTGRCELILNNGNFVYVKDGEISLTERFARQQYVYPRRIYEGMEFFIDMDAAAEQSTWIQTEFDIDFHKIRELYCPAGSTYISAISPEIEEILKKLWSLLDISVPLSIRIIKPAKMVQTPTAGVLFLWVCRDSREAAQGVQPLVAAKPPYRSAGKSPCAEISPRQSAHARKGV